MKMVIAYIVCAKFDGSGHTYKFGPYETMEKAKDGAKPYDGRPGWTVSIEEKEVPVSDFYDMGF